LIKYITSLLLKVAKCLSYIEEARCLKVNATSRLLCWYWDTLYIGFPEDWVLSLKYAGILFVLSAFVGHCNYL